MRKNSEGKIVNRVAGQQGTLPGGITNPDDIRLLICYIIVQLDRPIPAELLDEIIPGSGLVNYFDYAEALSFLADSGRLEKDENGCYSVSAAGRHASAVLQDSLPLSVRDKVLGRGIQVLRRGDVLAENDFAVEEIDGVQNLVCNMRDKDGGTLMSVSAAVGSSELSASLGRRFLANPSLLYNCVFAALSGDARTLTLLADELRK